jgi:hypothetical protein
MQEEPCCFVQSGGDPLGAASRAAFSAASACSAASAANGHPRSWARPPPHLPGNHRLRSWRCGAGTDRQVAVGGALLQDAQRGFGGRPRRAGTRQRRAREAVEARPRRGHGRGDDRDGATDGSRGRGRRAPRARERSGDDVRRDARVAHRPRAARGRATARPPDRGRPRRAPDEAGAAPTRRPAPRTAAPALSSLGTVRLHSRSTKPSRSPGRRDRAGHRARLSVSGEPSAAIHSQSPPARPGPRLDRTKAR